MIKEILLDSPFLNDRAMEWDVKNNQDLAYELVQNLNDTLLSIEDRLYLCSNEIGYNNRAFAIKFSDETKIFMNPMYQDKEALKLVREYDPITKKQFIIPRFTEVTLCFQNCLGKIEALKFNEAASPIVSQAMDCLDGIHSSDYGLEITEEFDKASPEEQQSVLNEYLKSLSTLRDNLDSELSNNDDTKKEWEGFKFLKAKFNGEIETDNSPKLNRKQRRFFEKLAKKFKRRNK